MKKYRSQFALDLSLFSSCFQSRPIYNRKHIFLLSVFI